MGGAAISKLCSCKVRDHTNEKNIDILEARCNCKPYSKTTVDFFPQFLSNCRLKILDKSLIFPLVVWTNGTYSILKSRRPLGLDIKDSACNHEVLKVLEAKKNRYLVEFWIFYFLAT